MADHGLVALAITLLLAHAVLIAIDPTIRFFLGDSRTYLYAATHDWIPPDRSLLYPLLIRWLVLPFGSLYPLLILQSIAAVAIAMIGYQVLRKSLGVDARIAGLAAMLIGLGPELLFFSRMVMAENLGVLALVTMVAVGCAYLRRGNSWWLLLAALLSLVVVSLRLSLLPVAMGMAVLPPLLFAICSGTVTSRRVLRAGAHLLLVVAAMIAMHSGYKAWYGAATESTAHDYVQEGGYFRLGLVLPLVKPVDLRGLGLPANFLVRFPDAVDPVKRESNLWLPDGIVAGLKQELGYDMGNRAARTIADRAILRDPVGLIRLAAITLRGYFNVDDARARMQDDAGANAIDDGLSKLLVDRFGYDGGKVHAVHGVTWHAYVASRWWFTFCLFTLLPLALLVAIIGWNSTHRAQTLFVALSSAGLTVAEMLFAHIASFRYLAPFPFFVWLCVAFLLATLFRRPRPLRYAIAAPAAIA